MSYPLLDVFITILWVGLWILWLILLFGVIADLFNDDSIGGWGKAGWMLFVLIIPFLGVLVYLIARGSGMAGRRAQQAELQEKAAREYVRKAAGPTAPSHELAQLAELRSNGDITEEEYERAKAKVLV